MNYIQIIPRLNLEKPLEMAKYYNNCGADEIALFDSAATKEGREPDIALIKAITRAVDIPLLYCGGIKKLEDVKKVLYAGAAKVCIKSAALADKNIIREVSERFGKDRLIITIDLDDKNIDPLAWAKEAKELGAGQLLLLSKEKEGYASLASSIISSVGIPVIISTIDSNKDTVCELLTKTGAAAISLYVDEEVDIMELKQGCSASHIEVNTFESSLSFDTFKLDDKGLIPVIAQDYKTEKVLMLAYMNKESFEKTIRTGKMTYFSRSRNTLWTKGETSGHFQYVKALTIDCDKDTILAKVAQVGPACHTGSESCFFTDLLRKEYDDTNPLTVFEDVYNVILDRKANPREGSYTNYLFGKGIDKILKKVGEECTEIVIAAKNPDAEEIKYEASDFLYHLMVLMVERGVTWDDITNELAERR